MSTDPALCVLYNDTCPICSREVAAYARAEGAEGVRFDRLDRAAAWGLTADQAAARFHVRQGDRLLSGLPAFRALWAALPRWRWLARLTGLPVVRPVLAFAYDRAAAPALYALHRRRQRRG